MRTGISKTLKGSHRESSWNFQPSLKFSPRGAKSQEKLFKLNVDGLEVESLMDMNEIQVGKNFGF